ncbi:MULTISPECIES: hypothetical protein [unclassified Variovorax]|uniref:hypothetical protein n=1 Tax=unclassified Variovorax TaxID=663243 RepID=UPI0008ABD4BF|nr:MULTISPECIES: hypothetical protein [unclassified Variovorax]SEK16226.1 hypothetical protein SAMN05518853_12310 [Variovorax sp. OK202]SFE42212.1 hypothetical protein SAMN05444746_12410 [Variovorax sp. OK212]
MKHQNQPSPAAAPAQIRVTVETLDDNGRVQRKASLINDFPAWAQEHAIERCLQATSVTAGNLLIGTLPIIATTTPAGCIENDPLDYSAVTHARLTPMDKVQRILMSPLAPDFTLRANEVGVTSLNFDDSSPEEYRHLIDELFNTYKWLVCASEATRLEASNRANKPRRK